MRMETLRLDCPPSTIHIPRLVVRGMGWISDEFSSNGPLIGICVQSTIGTSTGVLASSGSVQQNCPAPLLPQSVAQPPGKYFVRSFLQFHQLCPLPTFCDLFQQDMALQGRKMVLPRAEQFWHGQSPQFTCPEVLDYSCSYPQSPLPPPRWPLIGSHLFPCSVGNFHPSLLFRALRDFPILLALGLDPQDPP